MQKTIVTLIGGLRFQNNKKMNKRKNIQNTVVLGISGKIGAGKSTLAAAVKQKFEQLGWLVFERNFADKLKELVAFHYKIDITLCYTQDGKNTLLPIKPLSHKELKELVAFHFGYSVVAFETKQFLHSRYGSQVTINEMLNRWDALNLQQYSESAMTVGQALQKWGTALRNVDEQLWVKSVADYIQQKQFDNELDQSKHLLFIVPDTRFPNEASWIRNVMCGVLVRVNGDPGGVAKNSKRDLAHISETALDQYSHFDIIFDTNTTSVNNCVASICKLFGTA